MIEPGDLELRPLIAGESLDGYVADIAARNNLTKVRDISVVGGVLYGHRPQLTTQGWKKLPALARLLEIDVGELQHRCYPFSGPDGSRRAFFGTTMHNHDFRVPQRYFAPAALADQPHHRAMWQLKLPFDLDTGELLISRCPRPSCGKVQRWRHSAGVRYCDTCVQDLSEQDTLRLGDSFLPIYRLAAGLTHTDPKKRNAALAHLPAAVRALGPDMAFELMLRLVPVLEPKCVWTSCNRIWGNDPFDVARGMTAAWTILLDWPNSLLTKITTDLVDAKARRQDGNSGRTLAFLHLATSPSVAKPVAGAIRALHDSMREDGPNGERLSRNTMGGKEASKHISLSTALLVPLRRRRVFRTLAVCRGPTLVAVYDRKEIVAVACDIRRRCDLSSAAIVLGLPYYALEQLCALGRLQRLRHPYFTARYIEPQITNQTIFDLCKSITDLASSDLRDTAPVMHAMRAVGARLKPWDAVIEAMLSGTLPFEICEGEGPLFKRVRVSKDDLRGPAAQLITRAGAATALTKQMDIDFPFADRVTKRDAGEILNLETKQYTRLLSTYPTGPQRSVPVDELLKIAGDYIANTEIATRLGTSYQAVRGKASALGISRLCEAGYDRQLAERLLLR